MKKALITLLVLTLSTACKAEDSKQVTELKKRCEELSKETGDKYTLVSGVQIFNKVVPPIPCGISFEDKNGERAFETNKCKPAHFQYQVHLEDKNKYLNKILFDTEKPIETEEAKKLFAKDKNYTVCIKPSGYEDYLMGTLDTFTMIK